MCLTTSTQVQDSPAKPDQLQQITVDKNNQLPPDISAEFHNLHQEFQTAFEPTIRGNNKNFGFVQVIVNMSYVQPPQRKGRAPNTHKANFLTYKKNFVQLEQLGVFKKVEDVGVVAENLNPFFLIKKLAGGYHLVT